LAWALLPDIDAVITIAPRAAASASCAAFAKSHVARVLTLKSASQSSTV